MYRAIQKRRHKKQAAQHTSLVEEQSTSDVPDTRTLENIDSLKQASQSEATQVMATGKQDDPTISSAVNDSSDAPERSRKEKREAHIYLIKLTVGLLFPFCLQALDTTIIASALPFIASDFHKLSQMNWIVSAFTLTSATFILFWAQMADIFGRHVVIQVVLVMMMVGSAICTSAPVDAFPALIFGRAIQGLAAAGINVTVRTIMADKVSLREYSVNFSIFSFVSGLAVSVAPVLGGYLTNANWRWCFGINLPVAASGIILIFVVLRKDLLGPQPLPELLARDGETEGDQRMARFKARLSTIDFGGQLLFLFGVGLFILALTWGGGSYKWNDAHVLVPLVLGGILIFCFLWWEYMMVPGQFIARKLPTQRPMIPWKLVSQRNIGLLFYVNIATGMALTGVLYFTDLYFVLVRSEKPGQAGLQLIYYMPGVGVGVYGAMFMCNVYPRQTFYPLFLGSLIEATGITALSWALNHGQIKVIYVLIALAGCGTGLRLMPGSLHGIAFFPNNIAAVVSLMGFAVPCGYTLSMTIMNTVFNNRAKIPSSSSIHSTSNSTYLQSLSQLPPDVQDAIRNDAKMGVVYAFISILPFMWLSALAAASFGNVKITRKRKVDETGQTDLSENITESSFLLGLIRWNSGGKSSRNVNKEEETELKEVQPKHAATVEVDGTVV